MPSDWKWIIALIDGIGYVICEGLESGENGIAGPKTPKLWSDADDMVRLRKILVAVLHEGKLHFVPWMPILFGAVDRKEPVAMRFDLIKSVTYATEKAVLDADETLNPKTVKLAGEKDVNRVAAQISRISDYNPEG